MATIVEGFESDTPVVPRSGTWYRTAEDKFSGSYSLRSASIGHSASTECVMTVPAGAQTVSFRAKISTETGSSTPWDPLIFLTGTTERYRRAGIVDWHIPGTYALNGATTVTFRYLRDSSGDAGLNAVWIDDVVFTVSDTTPPTQPPNLRVTSHTGTQVVVAWDASTDNFAVAGYGVYLDGAKQGGDQTGRTYTFSGLAVGSHTIQVDAVDGDGNRSTKAAVSVLVDQTPPSVPGSLRATTVAPTQVSVAWDASADDVGVTGYGVWLDGVRQAGDDQLTLGWTFSGLTAGQTYLVEVDARDAAGNRSGKAQLTVVAEPDVTPPSAPTNLRVTAGGPYGFAVAWDPASDNVSVAGYGVYLDGAKQGGDQTALTRTLSGLGPATTYQVTVDAADASGNRSAPLQLTHITPADTPPGTPPNLRVTSLSYTAWTVEWDPAFDDVQVIGYDVAVDGQSVATATTERTLSRSGLPDDTAYTVRVWAVDHIGQRSAVPAELVVRTLDDTDPTPPVLTVTAGEEEITVSWTASTDDFAVAGYEVVVGGQVVHTTPGVDYTVDGIRTRRHTVAGLLPGAAYSVRVAAVDTIGQRSADNTQQVTTTPLPYVPIATPVYRLGGWAANVRDAHGVDWVVQRVEGWASSPPVSPVAADRGGMDGVWDGAGRYGRRRIVLEGVAIASSRAGMLAAKQRLARVLHPREQGLLRVVDARMARQARVRLDDRIEITDEGAVAFTWRLTVSAADPRRYAPLPATAAAIIESLPGEASMTVTMAGNAATIPARMRLYGPIRDWTIRHEESGTVMRAKPGTHVPADPDYSYTIDLGSRQVWAHVPALVAPGPRPGRRALAHLPAWWMLIPGTNTITLAGEPVPGQAGTPRLLLEAHDAWA